MDYIWSTQHQVGEESYAPDRRVLTRRRSLTAERPLKNVARPQPRARGVGRGHEGLVSHARRRKDRRGDPLIWDRTNSARAPACAKELLPCVFLFLNGRPLQFPAKIYTRPPHFGSTGSNTFPTSLEAGARA